MLKEKKLIEETRKQVKAMKKDFNKNLNLKNYYKLLDMLILVDKKLNDAGIKTGYVIDRYDNRIQDQDELNDMIEDCNLIFDYYIRLTYVYGKSKDDVKEALSNNENIKDYEDELFEDFDLINDCIINNNYTFNIYNYADDFDMLTPYIDDERQDILNVLPSQWGLNDKFKYYATTKDGTFITDFSKDIEDSSLNNIYNLYMMNNVVLYRIDL